MSPRTSQSRRRAKSSPLSCFQVAHHADREEIELNQPPSNEWVTILTPYDKEHFITYARLLDAEAEGADWRDVSRIVLHLDPDAEPERTRRCWEAHLKRAQWMTERGYRRLLDGTRGG